MPDNNATQTASPPAPAGDTHTIKLHERVAELEDELAILRQALALRQANTEATYRTVFDSVNDGIFIQDLETGAVVDLNRAAERLTGYGRHELLGAPLRIWGPDPAPTSLSAAGVHWQRATSGDQVRLEHAYQHKGGRRSHAEVTLKRVRLAGYERILTVVMDIAERKERARLQEELIQTQAALLAELSTPLIPISSRVVVMPMIGTIDERRAQQMLETLLVGITQRQADIAILDITGVRRVDAQVAGALARAARAAGLLGARLTLTGIRADIARTLVELGLDFGGIATHGTLQAGITAALGKAHAALGAPD